MSNKYEFRIIDLRRCIEGACKELFRETIISDVVYKAVDDAVEDFMYDHKVEAECE